MLLLLDLLYLNTTRATMMFLNSFLLHISYCSHHTSSSIDPTCPSTGFKTSSLKHQHPWLLPALVVCVKPFPLLNLTTETMWSACSSVELKTFPTLHLDPVWKQCTVAAAGHLLQEHHSHHDALQLILAIPIPTLVSLNKVSGPHLGRVHHKTDNSTKTTVRSFNS